MCFFYDTCVVTKKIVNCNPLLTQYDFLFNQKIYYIYGIKSQGLHQEEK